LPGIFLVWLCSLGFIAHAQAPLQVQAPVQATDDAANSTPVMQLKKIDPFVFYVQGVSEMGSSANQNFISNAGFVVTPAGVVVVDALARLSLRESYWLRSKKSPTNPYTRSY